MECEILLDGQKHRTIKSSYNALLGLRKASQSITIWIDAICINQDDLEERRAQVELMGTIYARASRCVVWLDQPTADCGLAMRFIRELYSSHEAFLPEELRRYMTKIGAIIYPEGYVPDEEWFRDNAPIDPTDPQWRAVMRLFSRPWFTRLWIIQEGVLSKETVFTCTSDSLSLKELQLGAQGVAVVSYPALSQYHLDNRPWILFWRINRLRAQCQTTRLGLTFPQLICSINGSTRSDILDCRVIQTHQDKGYSSTI